MAQHLKTCKEGMHHGFTKGKQQQSMANFKVKAKEKKTRQGDGRWLQSRPTLDTLAWASNKLTNLLAKNSGQINSKLQINLLISKCD